MWRLRFKDIEGRTRVLDISKTDEPDTSMKMLVGTDVPLTIDDDRNTDPYAPVRTSSGYVRVYGTEENGGLGSIEDLMPTNNTEHMAVLRDGEGNMLWQGYMKAENYGRHMYVLGEEADYALIDTLTALDGINMKVKSAFDMETFAAYITEALDAFPGHYAVPNIDKVMVPNENMAGLAAGEWLKLEVSRYNFFKSNNSMNFEDADYEPYDRISYLDVLKNIALLVGCTMTVKGDTLCFVSQSATQYVLYTWGEMQTLAAGGNADGTVVSMQERTWTLAEMEHSEYENTLTTIHACKSVKVTGEVNPYDDTEIGVSTAGLEYVRQRNLTINNGKRIRALIYNSKQGDIKLESWRFYKKTDSPNYCDVVLRGYDSGTDELIGDGGLSTQIARIDIYEQKDVDEGTKINYDFKDAIFVDCRVPSYLEELKPGWEQSDYCSWPACPVATIKGSYLPPQNMGCFDLAFTVAASIANVTPPMTASLRVGNKYWSGNSWVTEPASFLVPLLNNRTKVTKTLDMPYAGATAHVIPIETEISGEVELTLFLSDTVVNGRAGLFAIYDVSVRYCNMETETFKELLGTNTYSAKTGAVAQEKKEVQIMMTTKTDDCKNGFGIIYKDGAPYRDGVLEKRLMNLLKRQYANNTEQAEPTIRGYIPAIGERCAWNGKTWQVLARSVNWRDADTKLLMTEIK